MTYAQTLTVSTKGFNDILDITGQVSQVIKKSGVKDGICLVFVAHSTCALTTIEYEEGALKDLKRALEIVAPMNEDYEHCKKWPARQSPDGSRPMAGGGDCNGYAHVRAALMKPSLAVPIEGGKLVLGTWQQVVLCDFDNRPRERRIMVKVIGG